MVESVGVRPPITVITTHLIVHADGTVSIADPLPPGEFKATITDVAAPAARRGVREMIVHDGPWDDSISLRREDMYGDDGR